MEASSLTRKLRDSRLNYSLQLRSFIILFERKTIVAEEKDGIEIENGVAVTLKFSSFFQFFQIVLKNENNEWNSFLQWKHIASIAA